MVQEVLKRNTRVKGVQSNQQKEQRKKEKKRESY